jgi:hypothetical protein
MVVLRRLRALVSLVWLHIAGGHSGGQKFRFRRTGDSSKSSRSAWMGVLIVNFDIKPTWGAMLSLRAQ